VTLPPGRAGSSRRYPGEPGSPAVLRRSVSFVVAAVARLPPARCPAWAMNGRTPDGAGPRSATQRSGRRSTSFWRAAIYSDRHVFPVPLDKPRFTQPFMNAITGAVFTLNLPGACRRLFLHNPDTGIVGVAGLAGRPAPAAGHATTAPKKPSRLNDARPASLAPSVCHQAQDMPSCDRGDE